MTPAENVCPRCDRMHSIHTDCCVACGSCLPSYVVPSKLFNEAVKSADKFSRALSEFGTDDIRCALEGEPDEILKILAS